MKVELVCRKVVTECIKNADGTEGVGSAAAFDSGIWVDEKTGAGQQPLSLLTLNGLLDCPFEVNRRYAVEVIETPLAEPVVVPAEKKK